MTDSDDTARKQARTRRDAERDTRDTELPRRSQVVADATAAATRLPEPLATSLVALFEALRPARAADGYMSYAAVGSNSDEIVALAEAVLTTATGTT